MLHLLTTPNNGTRSNYVKHPFVQAPSALEKILSHDGDSLTKIIMILRDFSGIDFSYYKENTIIRRLERRVSINRFETLEQYLQYLSESDKEKDTLYREMLIGVTRFFRDSGAFASLEKTALPLLFEKCKPVLRIWSAGCSTGEEIYSLAIMLQEYKSANNIACEIKIFATDIDRNALEIAGQGLYSDSLMADVDPALLTKYFTRQENGYRVQESIRSMVVFATHNLLKDPPFSRLDMIICRNLFIYFKSDMQARMLAAFYSSLTAGGILFMGSSETLGDVQSSFETLDSKWKIYRHKPGTVPVVPHESGRALIAGTGSMQPLGSSRGNERHRVEKMYEAVLSACIPPSLILDSSDNVVQVIGDINQYVKIQPGRFTHNLFSMLPKELSFFATNILRRLRKENHPTATETLAGLVGEGKRQVVLEGRVAHVDEQNFWVLTFHEVDITAPVVAAASSPSPGPLYAERTLELERELMSAKENLQATVEELETSNEELQSSNEELIASNEELQSTNEELQSVNEELYTVNNEYQSKIEELTRLNGDMNNLLRNTEVGALYLDRKLCIRKITPTVTAITNIMASDIGRPISHLSIVHTLPTLLADIESVGDSLQPVDREMIDAGGKNWLARVRPYRTDFNAVDGILVTFVDISPMLVERKRADVASSRLQEALHVGNMAWWEWDIVTDEVLCDERKATMLGYLHGEFPRTLDAVCALIHPDDHERAMTAMRDHLHGREKWYDVNYRIKRKDGGWSWYYDRGGVVKRSPEGKPLKVIGMVVDITTLKTMESDLEAVQHLQQMLFENSPVAHVLIEADGTIAFVNRKAEDLFGITKSVMTSRHYDAPVWGNLDLEGKPMESEDLPFSVILQTGKPLLDFRHYVAIPGRERTLISVSGSPIKNRDGSVTHISFAVTEIPQ